MSHPLRSLLPSLSAYLFAGVLLPLAATTLAAAAIDYTEQAFQFPASVENLVVADTNGDGLNDLIAVVDDSIRIYFQSETGFDFEAGFDSMQLPGTAIGWDLSTSYGAPGQAALIALIDGREVLAWSIDKHSITPPVSIISGLGGYLAQGINRLHFSRDVNADGLADLIVPGAGELQLYLRTSAGDYSQPLHIKSDVQLRANLETRELERRVGQAIAIPALQLRDINADGADDIVSRTEARLDVFLANPGAATYYASTPSFTLDITAIEERLGEFDVDNLDFSNLTGVLALTHEEILEDMDGDNIADLLLREGGKVSLFGGSSLGIDMSQPRQVLRSSGNVLSTFLYDENEDGLKDLWLWRVESISVGDLFVWLALSGSVAIEAFIYPNEGERFARRPSRQITVELKFPSAIRMATSLREIRNDNLDARNRPATPVRIADLDADPSARDLLVLINNEVSLFLNSIEPEPAQRPFLGALGYSRQRNNYEIDVREVIDSLGAESNPLMTRVENRTPDRRIPLGVSVNIGDIIPARLNRDARDDLLVFTDLNHSHIEGILLLSNDANAR